MIRPRCQRCYWCGGRWIHRCASHRNCRGCGCRDCAPAGDCLSGHPDHEQERQQCSASAQPGEPAQWRATWAQPVLHDNGCRIISCSALARSRDQFARRLLCCVARRDRGYLAVWHNCVQTIGTQDERIPSLQIDLKAEFAVRSPSKRNWRVAILPKHMRQQGAVRMRPGLGRRHAPSFDLQVGPGMIARDLCCRSTAHKVCPTIANAAN